MIFGFLNNKKGFAFRAKPQITYATALKNWFSFSDNKNAKKEHHDDALNDSNNVAVKYVIHHGQIIHLVLCLVNKIFCFFKQI